jgi:beta-glucanase (GH16 family)
MAWPGSEQASAAPPAEVVWEDNFDGASGTAPDASKWVHEVNGDGGGNSELQYYTDRTENASLDGEGNLVITARKENPADYQCHYGRCEYTSARLNTSRTFKQKYGRFEARIKIPRGQGIWPAFWMLGGGFPGTPWPDCGEIDILENIGKEPTRVHGSLHGPGYSGGNAITGSYDHPEGKAFADDFHTFAVEWSPDSIAWFVDGKEYQRKTPADANGKPWPYNQEFFMILNVAVGGGWPGPPDGSTQFPQQMLIDYVRVSSL